MNSEEPRCLKCNEAIDLKLGTCACLDGPEEYERPEGIPRKCGKCGTFAHYKRPDGVKRKECFTVACPFCYHKFEVVPYMRGGRG